MRFYEERPGVFDHNVNPENILCIGDRLTTVSDCVDWSAAAEGSVLYIAGVFYLHPLSSESDVFSESKVRERDLKVMHE